MSPFSIILFLTLGVTAFARPPTFDDLHSVLKTDERIYMVLRTYDKESTDDQIHTCAYAQQKSLSQNRYDFIKHFKVDDKRTDLELFADLIPEKQPKNGPKMHVHNKPGSKGREYTLRFWESASSCAIFTFTNKDGKTECEMYKRQSNIYQSSATCDNKFDNLCHNRQNYTVQAGCE